MNPLDPSEQDYTVIHYLNTIGPLAESDEAKQNFEKAQCLSMCSKEEIHQRDEVEVGAQSNFEMRSDGSLFSQHAVRRF